MIIVGSATPTIIIGCPPIMECMMPHIAVEVNVSTVLKAPSIINTKYFIQLFQSNLSCKIYMYLIEN